MEDKTIQIYEVEIQWKGEEDAQGSVSHYCRAKSGALDEARNPSKIPAGAMPTRARVYRCVLPSMTPRAMMWALLNREIEPRRVALVYGDLPMLDEGRDHGRSEDPGTEDPA